MQARSTLELLVMTGGGVPWDTWLVFSLETKIEAGLPDPHSDFFLYRERPEDTLPLSP